jgi:hypothetical protein
MGENKEDCLRVAVVKAGSTGLMVFWKRVHGKLAKTTGGQWPMSIIIMASRREGGVKEGQRGRE